MNGPAVRVFTEEWPQEQWLARTNLLGDNPFLVIEGDPSRTEWITDDEKILALSVTIGGGFKAAGLPDLLRRLAELIELQETKATRPAERQTSPAH